MRNLSLKHSISCIVFLIVGSFTVEAQNSQWEWALNGGGMNNLGSSSSSYNDFERVTHVAVDDNDNYYFQALFLVICQI